jgi:glycosyltransferase involved in cell wall biosynthesis
MTRLWTALPNFVDCAVFRPVQSLAEKQAIRQSLGIPEAAFVVGCVAAVKKHHKRVDYLIHEFARFCSNTMVSGGEEFEHQGAKNAKGGGSAEGGAAGVVDSNQTPAGAASSPRLPLRALRLGVQTSFPFLFIAGARTDETAELIMLAESLIPGRYKIMTDCSRARMPDLLRSMDVFVLTSLFEMMPIALLEALASGLPCVVNQHPVLEWMTGSEEKSIEHQGAKYAKERATAEDGGDQKFGILNPYPAGAASSPRPPLRTSRASVQTSSAGGMAIDMSQEGALAAALAALTPEWLAMHGRQARERAVKMFSTETVIGQYVKYYGEVMRNE